ncbi:MAG: phosphoserine phosphatase SerB [Pseudomonadota bacterium]
MSDPTYHAVVVMGPGAPDALDSVAWKIKAPMITLGPDAAEVHLPAGVAADVAKNMRSSSFDIACVPLEGRRKKLLLADMDATIIEQESLDVLADAFGFGREVAKITDRAMRGELDFESALKTRVALLRGHEIDKAAAVLRERITITAGAKTLVKTMSAHGARSALVTGGFDMFAAPVAERVGFDEVYANRLRSTDFRFTGQVAEPILGQNAKAERLETLCREHGLRAEDVMAVGDGANDRAMITAAGYGVGFRPKPVLAGVADAVLRHTDLTALLYIQGFRRDEFVLVG